MADARASDAGTQAPEPVQLADHFLELVGHSPSGRYVVAEDEDGALLVLLDTQRERPPRSLPADPRAGNERCLFSANEEVIAFLHEGNLVVADVAEDGPARVMGPWEKGVYFGPDRTNTTAEDSFQWLLELSSNGRWIAWTLDQDSAGLTRMLWAASTQTAEQMIAERVVIQGGHTVRFSGESARFLGDKVIYGPAGSDHIVVRDLETGTVQTLRPGPRFHLLPPRILVTERQTSGDVWIATVGESGTQPLAAEASIIITDRAARRAAWFSADDLIVYDSVTAVLTRVGAFPTFRLVVPTGFSGTGEGLLLGERGCPDPACTVSSLFVDAAGPASVLSWVGGSRFTLPRTAAAIVREPGVGGTVYYVRTPGEERRLLGTEVSFRVKASPDGRRLVFLDGPGAQPELKVLDLDSDTVLATGAYVWNGRSYYGITENGALIGLVGLQIYAHLDRPGPLRLTPTNAASMVILPGNRVAYANALGVFVVEVPAP